MRLEKGISGVTVTVSQKKGGMLFDSRTFTVYGSTVDAVFAYLKRQIKKRGEKKHDNKQEGGNTQE